MLSLNTFLFKCSKEGFHQRVIITITFFARTDDDARFFEQGEIPKNVYWLPRPLMMNQTSSWLSLRERYFCCFDY